MTSLSRIAEQIKEEWERRARSPDREFFVASHEGWDTAEGRERQARGDVQAMLSYLDLETARSLDFLDLGCGTGRLVPYAAPHFRTYTGLDISPTMLAVARAACASIPNARFFETDGISIPEAARDRLYGVAIAAGVLIHCPKEVCETLGAVVMRQLHAGGELRVQLLADPDDPTGITPGPDPGMDERAKKIERSASAAQLELITGTRYQGHRFHYREAEAWLRSLGSARIFRYDPHHIYALVTKDL